MFKNFKIYFFISLLLSLFNEVIANDDFFEEAEKKFNEKKLKIQNFYFKEVLSLIQKMLKHIYI